MFAVSVNPDGAEASRIHALIQCPVFSRVGKNRHCSRPRLGRLGQHRPPRAVLRACAAHRPDGRDARRARSFSLLIISAAALALGLGAREAHRPDGRDARRRPQP